MTKLVTKDSLRDMLNNPNPRFAIAVIGKALVRIYERQTASEQSDLTTKVENGIGFTGADALGGSLTAKYYMRHQTLQVWQVERWMKVGKDGYPRLCKYWKQLNEVANERRQLTLTNS